MGLRLERGSILRPLRPGSRSETAAAPVPLEPLVETAAVAVPTQIQTFLDELSRSLDGIPAPLRDEARAEWLGHLLASVAAREEMGESHENAVAAAIAAFGTAERHIRPLRRGYLQRERAQNPSAAFVFALRTFAVVAFGDALVAALWLTIHPQADSPSHELWCVYLLGWMALLSPFLTGWRVGRETRQLAVRASFFALLLTPALLMASAIVVRSFVDSWIAPFFPVNSEYLYECLLWCGIYHVIRLPIGLLGAKFGGNPPRLKRAKAGG